MKKFFLFLTVLTGLTNLCAGKVWAIENGSEAAPNSKPYMVSIESNSSPVTHLCNGVLITPTIVLTSAQCVASEPIATLNVLLGAHNRFASEPSQIRINAKQVKWHEEYNPKTLANNIALIFLSSPAPLGVNIGLVTLPAWDTVVSTGKTVSIMGWGATKIRTGNSPVLREGSMKVENISICQQASSGFSVSNATNICATAASANMCSGDGGGAMIDNGTLVGLDSVGGTTDCLASKEVFVKVAPYMDWIEINKQ